MIRLIFFLLIIFISIECAGKEGGLTGLEQLVEKSCKTHNMSLIKKENCDLANLDSDLQEFFRDRAVVKEISLVQLEKLVKVLELKKYSLFLAEKYISEGDPCRANELVGSMLDQAALYLYMQGKYYFLGICVKPDFEIAYTFFEKAARKGNLDGAYYVAFLKYFGKGVEQDVRYAAELLASLTAFNHLKSERLVNYLIENGYADSKNFADSVSSRKHLYELQKERDSKEVLSGENLRKFLLENGVSKPIPFDSLQAPILEIEDE